VREEMGLDNVRVMIPFCRTVGECDRVLAEMAANGLERGKQGLEVWLMCEIPSNVVLASEFARRIDGFSIGSNDLTQLVLGVDRDSPELRALFDERDPAVKAMIERLIRDAHAAGVTVSFCGQAPSDDPSFAAFLVECGIDSVSVSPDALLATRQAIADAEAVRTSVDRR
jgi:pyruvate,water dikinase